MGRDASITFEQVVAAAEAMQAEGIKTTARAVRERLGSTGSMGTIVKLLGRWKGGLEPVAKEPVALPPRLQAMLVEFLEQERTVARTAVEVELAAQQQDAVDLATDNERLGVEIAYQSKTMEDLRAQVATQVGRAGQLEQELALVRSEAALERGKAELVRAELATELAKAQLRLELVQRLDAELAALRASLELERTARQQAEQAAAVLTAKLEFRESAKSVSTK